VYSLDPALTESREAAVPVEALGGRDVDEDDAAADLLAVEAGKTVL
jgi:hypothetical protein